MIRKDFRKEIFVVQCDGCEHFDEIDADNDFKALLTKMKTDGWSTSRKGEEYEHYCSKCSGTKSTNTDEAKAPKKIAKGCPECYSDMYLRDGKFGKFYGCSGYPKCKHTERVDFGLRRVK